ncbi:hypothetical protein V8E51_003758 [Hyaloscypha variabilis]
MFNKRELLRLKYSAQLKASFIKVLHPQTPCSRHKAAHSSWLSSTYGGRVCCTANKDALRRRSKVSPLQGKPSTLTTHSHPAQRAGELSGSSLKNVTNNPVDGSTNWSGAVISPAPSGTFTSIEGQFTIPVPTVHQVPLPETTMSQYGSELTDLATTMFSKPATFHGMSGTLLDLSVIEGFPANPSNEIFISLTEVSPSVGNVLFEKLSQGVGAQGDISSPTPSADLQGISVEWFVEDPGLPQVPFLDFGTVIFTNCAAGISTGTSANLATSTLLSLITESDGTITSILTDEALLSDTSVEIVYVGP